MPAAWSWPLCSTWIFPCGRGRPDPGDLVEPGSRVTERGQVLPDLRVDGGDVEDGGDQRLRAT
jgi:hypothetical protein